MTLLKRGDEQERVICAAVWVDDGKVREGLYLPTNISSGVVFSGWRHHNCIGQIKLVFEKERRELESLPKVKCEDGFERVPDSAAQDLLEALHGNNQGFLTSRGRFVGREEAAKIAVAAGQVDPSVDWLMSEHLY